MRPLTREIQHRYGLSRTDARAVVSAHVRGGRYVLQSIFVGFIAGVFLYIVLAIVVVALDGTAVGNGLERFGEDTLGVPLVVPLFFGAIIAGSLCAVFAARRTLVLSGLAARVADAACLRCGYDLRGIGAGTHCRCPECGLPNPR